MFVRPAVLQRAELRIAARAPRCDLACAVDQRASNCQAVSIG